MYRELLLLGLLRGEEMHGYMLNEFIESHLGSGIHLKKPTAYRLLNRMATDGWIKFREDQEGNRPPRRVYSLTPKGEEAFQKLLHESLTIYKPPEFLSDVSLGFLDTMDPEDALQLLIKRRSAAEHILNKSLNFGEHPGSLQLIIEHYQHHLSSELEWLDKLIHDYERNKTDKG